MAVTSIWFYLECYCYPFNTKPLLHKSFLNHLWDHREAFLAFQPHWDQTWFTNTPNHFHHYHIEKHFRILLSPIQSSHFHSLLPLSATDKFIACNGYTCIIPKESSFLHTYVLYAEASTPFRFVFPAPQSCDTAENNEHSSNFRADLIEKAHEASYTKNYSPQSQSEGLPASFSPSQCSTGKSMSSSTRSIKSIRHISLQ